MEEAGITEIVDNGGLYIVFLWFHDYEYLCNFPKEILFAEDCTTFLYSVK
jgi:hypothetical protein